MSEGLSLRGECLTSISLCPCSQNNIYKNLGIVAKHTQTKQRKAVWLLVLTINFLNWGMAFLSLVE